AGPRRAISELQATIADARGRGSAVVVRAREADPRDRGIRPSRHGLSGMMRVVSVNIALPKRVLYKGRTVSTAIFKEPVAGKIRVRAIGLQGDAVADPRVHGAPMKAVYAYPSEHYAFWRREFPAMELPWGMFGENLTTEGLREEEVHVGGQYRVGTAVLKATNPRFPCFK